MTPDIRKMIQDFGPELTPEMLGGTQALMAERFGGMDPATKVMRDVAYGDHERHVLDIHVQDGTKAGAVLVFVHGGGFIMGNKSSDSSPFYDNVGDFAARNGMVGVTINYRLAPEFKWPSGGEDIARAVDWLIENIAVHGGDPARIFVMGQSAGAVHCAEYVARFKPKAAGALLISGIYNVAAVTPNDFQGAYYGTDPAGLPPTSTVAGLLTTKIPVFMAVSEFDPADFQLQAASYAERCAATNRRFPHLIWLAGHNHLSPVLEIGSPGADLERHILDFINAA